MGKKGAAAYEGTKDAVKNAWKNIEEVDAYYTQKAIDWKKARVQEMKDVKNEIASLSTEFGSLVKGAAVENWNDAKKGVANAYKRLETFRDDALMAARYKKLQIKAAWEKWGNDRRQKQLMAKYEKFAEKERVQQELADRFQKAATESAEKKKKMASLLNLKDGIDSMPQAA